MSLIPSESYSFPDHFTRTVTPSRRPREAKSEPDAVEIEPRKRPTIVALPDPELEPEPIMPLMAEPEPEIYAEEPVIEPAEPVEPAPPIEPIRKPAPPNPALRRVNATLPRIPEVPARKMAMPVLKPKVRWNNRAAAIEPAPAQNNGNGAHDEGIDSAPAQNVIPIKPAKVQARPPAPPTAMPRPMPVAPPPAAARPIPQPIQNPLPKPAPAPQVRPQKPAAPPKPRPALVSNSQADFFEMFAEDSHAVAMKRRRQMKFRRFMACEVAALAVLLPLVILGLTLNVTTPALLWIMNIFTIAAAVAAAVIPIVFYAFTPTLPELER